MSRSDTATVKCVVMFSGGLDSVIATHLLMSQGLDVTALHFVLPFESGLGRTHRAVVGYAEALAVKLRIVEEGDEFLSMVKNPAFGYGKHANPCVDCRIHRLVKAQKIMEELGGRFLATGEVIGQRPMSQRRDAMLSIARRSGLKGLLLRPLCAKLLEPTIAETEGWVDREKLLGISGRSRKEQFAYAKAHGLKHGAPGGGCLLTQKEVGVRFMDLREHEPAFALADFKLLAYGRHFRLNGSARLVVGRNHGENESLLKLLRPGDRKMHMAEVEGPVGIVRGAASENDLTVAASIVARYSKERVREKAKVKVTAEAGAGWSEVSAAVSRSDDARVVEVAPATDSVCDELRI